MVLSSRSSMQSMMHCKFTDRGYVDMGELLTHAPAFTVVVGGRGTGKTYGALEYVRYTNPTRFLLMRRTQTQIDLLKKPQFNPFKAVDAVHGGETSVRSYKDSAVFYEGEHTIGYAIALSTMHNVRGIDISDVDIMIYDEFIPESLERVIKDEYNAFLNAVETVARNRELQGRDPLKVLMLSNSNRISNPYFIGMGILRVIRDMRRKGDSERLLEDRGLLLIQIKDSPISHSKTSTSLYKMAGTGAFASMALDNEYNVPSVGPRRRVPLRECRPMVQVGELCIYEHKSSDRYYACALSSGSPVRYQPDPESLKAFRSRYGISLYKAYMAGDIICDDDISEELLRIYLAI